MPTVAILPIKDFEQAKQRLSPALERGHRRALMQAMFRDTLVALRRSVAIDRILVVTASADAAELAGEDGITVVEDTASSHSQAAMLGITRARELGAERVALVPGDCPLLTAADLDALLALAVSAPSVLIVPDRHGAGTNALVLTPPDALEPAFGVGSCERHQQLAHSRQATPEVVEVATLALDIDTPEDLQELIVRFESTRGGAAHTRGTLTQMLRSHAG